MSFVVVGTNHKFSPVEIREKLYFSRIKQTESLIHLIAHQGIKAAVILSTCNRVELYAHTQDAHTGVHLLKEFLASSGDQDLTSIEPYLYTYIGKEAIRHLIKVAAGLDSQIIGEEQILEQVELAYERARFVETVDSFLEMIFIASLKTAQKARQETRISEGDISVATIAIELIKKEYTNFQDRKVLIIGVGKISQLLTRRLKEEGLTSVFIANKTFKKAKQLAKCINAQVLRFDKLKEKLQEADIVISATSSPHLILRKEDIQEALSLKPSAINHKPLLIIDLAVPRDVDPQAKGLERVRLFCLDDLNELIENNLTKRRESIPLAEEIIHKEVNAICSQELLESPLARAL